MNYPRLDSCRRRAGFAALALLGLSIAETSAADFTWTAGTGNWSAPGNWGGTAPTGSNPSDVLTFAGNVQTPYTATDDLAGPFLLNQLVFNATDSTGLPNPPTHFLAGVAGSALRFSNPSPQILANAAGGVRIDLPIQLTAPLTLAGSGTGVITLNNTVSGSFDIVKNGTSTFRFGSQTVGTAPNTTELPSDNTWFGTLTLNNGTVRFNNNAAAGRTALRANPVVLNSGTARLSVSSELRVGTISGSAGTVESQVVAGTNTPNVDNENLVIHLTGSGSFGGTLRLGNSAGMGASNGELIFRGSGTQTLTGTLDIRRDVVVGRSAQVVLAGTASLSAQANGAIVLNGGSLTLDNTQVNVARLRDGTSTGLDTIGGGSFNLVGNSAGTVMPLGGLQLGSANNLRSGHVNVRVIHSGGNTILDFASYTRNATTLQHYTTLDFSAANSSGNVLTLGQAGTGPRVTFTGFFVPTANGLINTNAGTDSGWATVNGTDFANYSATQQNGAELGVIAVVPTAFSTSNQSANALLTGSGTVAAAFDLNSLKMAPASAGQALSITGSGALNNRNFLLAGAQDFTIQNTGGGTGGITGAGTRYFHVQQATLNVNVPLGVGATNRPIVKAGAGTLALGRDNSAITAPVVINAGVLRSSIANLPQGELRLRGGVYEIEGGGTFSRSVSFGNGSLNWSGIDPLVVGNPAIDTDRGSGGFAAIGGEVTLDFTGAAGPTNFSWEDKGFVNSGHALVFGSTRADSRVTWSDNLGLSSTQGTINYNAREIRVVDNPAMATDSARVAGVISGRVQDDLLKTGDGTLEIIATSEYLGATLIAEGTLLVNGSTSSSFLTDVRASGTLGGKGTTGAVRVEAQGTLAPGEFAGRTSILTTGELRLTGATARLSLEIGGLTAGGNGTSGYDRLVVNGGVFLGGGELTGTLLGGYLPTAGDLFFIIINDGNELVDGQLLQGGSISFGGVAFEISYAGDLAAGTFSGTPGANDIVLRAVPEPSLALLGSSGLVVLALRRRRQA